MIYRTGPLKSHPCGMNKGDIVTDISAKDPLNVTWHLGYPHRGGFKIELLDAKGRLVRALTPPGEWVGDRITRHTVRDLLHIKLL